MYDLYVFRIIPPLFIYLLTLQFVTCPRTQSGTFMDGDLLVNRDGVRIVSHSDVAPVRT